MVAKSFCCSSSSFVVIVTWHMSSLFAVWICSLSNSSQCSCGDHQMLCHLSSLFMPTSELWATHVGLLHTHVLWLVTVPVRPASIQCAIICCHIPWWRGSLVEALSMRTFMLRMMSRTLSVDATSHSMKWSCRCRCRRRGCCVLSLAVLLVSVTAFQPKESNGG